MKKKIVYIQFSLKSLFFISLCFSKFIYLIIMVNGFLQFMAINED